MMDQIKGAIQGHESPDANVSKLQVYTIGTAAENLALNSFDLEINPDEHMPMVDGELSTNANQEQATGTDLSGTQYQTNLTSSGSIKATWLPLGQPNRMTAPNVRRGEQVIVYRFGDVDKFYWNTMRNDLAFRRLETVVFAISGTPMEGATADQSATYFLEMSSHKKSITLSTSKANGEPYAYTFTFDTGNGKITLTDDIDNTIFLDSAEHQIHMQNADGSFLDIDKFAISGYARDSIDFKTKAYSVEATDTIKHATKDHSIQATTTELTAENNTITAETVHNGNIGLNGDLTTAPGSAGSGKISIKGEAELLGDMDVKGNMTAVTIEATESITAPNLKYN
jgi:hypothetical protein